MILFHAHINANFHVLLTLNLKSKAPDTPTYWLFSSVNHTNVAVVRKSDVAVSPAPSIKLLQL